MLLLQLIVWSQKVPLLKCVIVMRALLKNTQWITQPRVDPLPISVIIWTATMPRAWHLGPVRLKQKRLLCICLFGAALLAIKGVCCKRLMATSVAPRTPREQIVIISTLFYH